MLWYHLTFCPGDHIATFEILLNSSVLRFALLFVQLWPLMFDSILPTYSGVSLGVWWKNSCFDEDLYHTPDNLLEIFGSSEMELSLTMASQRFSEGSAVQPKGCSARRTLKCISIRKIVLYTPRRATVNNFCQQKSLAPLYNPQRNFL